MRMTGRIAIKPGLLLVSFLCVGCDPSPTDNFKNVFRAVNSPNSTVTAHVARNASGGAAGSLVYDVFLTENGSEGEPERVFNGYGDCDPNVEWQSDQLLIIQYAAANCDIYGFRNFYWRDKDIGPSHGRPPRLEIKLVRIEPPGQ
jgi:hypothetical protein